MIFAALFVTITLIGLALIAAISMLTFPRLGQTSATEQHPRVSILIPARNEASVVGNTICRLLAQTYPHFDILLLDDNSTDNTAAVARAAAGNDPRLKILTGESLPPAGWVKTGPVTNWRKRRRATSLIFTDADVIWSHHNILSTVINFHFE